jgi:hypothetical protein
MAPFTPKRSALTTDSPGPKSLGVRFVPLGGRGRAISMIREAFSTALLAPS